MPKSPNIVITTEPGAEPIPTEIFIEELIALSEAMNKLTSSRLSDKAILLLIQNNMAANTRLSMGDIQRVLIAARTLSATYIKKDKK